MRAVYKHKLELTTDQVVPFGLHQLVHIGIQDNELYVWFEHREGEHETSSLHIVGTGQFEILDNWFHLETVMLGSFVWHVYAEFEHAD